MGTAKNKGTHVNVVKIGKIYLTSVLNKCNYNDGNHFICVQLVPLPTIKFLKGEGNLKWKVTRRIEQRCNQLYFCGTLPQRWGRRSEEDGAQFVQDIRI